MVTLISCDLGQFGRRFSVNSLTDGEAEEGEERGSDEMEAELLYTRSLYRISDGSTLASNRNHRGAGIVIQKFEVGAITVEIRHGFCGVSQQSPVTIHHLQKANIAGIGVDLAGILGERIARAEGGLVPSGVGYGGVSPLQPTRGSGGAS